MSAKERDSFKSSLGVILALIGSAIGLGNLWRFPYLVGTNGGAAFIIIYLVCIVFLCMPIMVGEFVIGRRSQANVFGAFKKLSPGSGWKHTGALAVLTCITLLSFYVVVGGWTIDYFVKSLRMVFTPQTDFAAEFNNMVSSTGEILSFTVLFLVINGVVILAGVRKGIERTNKYLMSMLAVLIVLIAVYSLTLPGAKQGLDFLFKPDFSKVNFDTALNALGQGFLSLSIGCGSIITYASYTRKETNLLKTTTITTLSDTAFAIIAGIAILPAVFSAGMNPSEGAGLAFVSLPYVFANMPMGKIISILFYFILFAAALSSSISITEPVVAFMKEEFRTSRLKAVITSFFIVLLFAVLCALSFGLLANFKLFGKTFFDFFDYISSNLFLTIGALLAAVFAGWKIKKEDFYDELTSGGKYKIPKWILKSLRVFVRYIAPLVVATIIVNSLIGN